MPDLYRKYKVNLPAFIICLFSPLILAECIRLAVPNPNVVLQSLNLPAFIPPGIVFVIVWVILYLIMGLALYSILTLDYKNIRLKYSALLYFFLQLAFNYLWFVVFFGFQYRGLSVLIITLLLALAIATWKRLRAISISISRLWLLYLIWLAFAAFLTYIIWILNL